MKSYDLVIIGSGPGGYVSGLYASRHKMSVAVIERGPTGGTCLNVGCIPTKSLLHSASILSTIKNSSIFGIDVRDHSFDYNRIVDRKEEVVTRLRTGIETLFRANKIDLIKGDAKNLSGTSVAMASGEEISGKFIIIATGSSPQPVPAMPFDGNGILSSDDMLSLRKLPSSAVIVGGGVVGCEFAQLLSAFGCKVTIVEMMERLLPSQSREASKKLEMIFKKRGIDIFCSSKVVSLKKGVNVELAIDGGKTISAEKALIAVGRSRNTSELGGLNQLGIGLERGTIIVDHYLETAAKNIYAIGDCVNGPQLAHKASYDGIVAVRNMLGERVNIDYSLIPNCIWTEPEIASIGMTEEEAKSKVPDIRIAKFPYLGSGKAFLMDRTEGFIKLMGDSDGKIHGVEIFGVGACDLIGEASLAKSVNANIRDWARVVHGHPTLSEIVQEACHVFCGTPIHSV